MNFFLILYSDYRFKAALILLQKIKLINKSLLIKIIEKESNITRVTK